MVEVQPAEDEPLELAVEVVAALGREIDEGVPLDEPGHLLVPHVADPVGPAAARDRYSVVLFHVPNPDALITCLEPCQSPERPAQYPPISAGEHLSARIRASRGHVN